MSKTESWIISRVAGTTVPAFVERLGTTPLPRLEAMSVAGTTVPAFVERRRHRPSPLGSRRVSPGLRSRPSLSGTAVVQHRSVVYGVAGTTVPAFVERRCTCLCARPGGVSPGLRSRPSLSELQHRSQFRPCPSGVAGTMVPAFVERWLPAPPPPPPPPPAPVSPGLRSRPSLSDASEDLVTLCHPRRVAGTTVPAFVERSGEDAACRSGDTGVAGTNGPGLR